MCLCWGGARTNRPCSGSLEVQELWCCHQFESRPWQKADMCSYILSFSSVGVRLSKRFSSNRTPTYEACFTQLMLPVLPNKCSLFYPTNAACFTQNKCSLFYPTNAACFTQNKCSLIYLTNAACFTQHMQPILPKTNAACLTQQMQPVLPNKCSLFYPTNAACFT